MLGECVYIAVQAKLQNGRKTAIVYLKDSQKWFTTFTNTHSTMKTCKTLATCKLLHNTSSGTLQQHTNYHKLMHQPVQHSKAIFTNSMHSEVTHTHTHTHTRTRTHTHTHTQRIGDCSFKTASSSVMEIL